MNPGSRKAIARAGLYADMALSIPASALVGYGIGYLLDGWLGTTWLRVLFLLILIVGAFTRMVLQILGDQKSK